jgi:hypothetical protein
MKLIIKPYRWEKIDDVPQLTLEWAMLIGGKDISIQDINELTSTYEDYLDNIKLDDIVQPVATNEQ